MVRVPHCGWVSTWVDILFFLYCHVMMAQRLPWDWWGSVPEAHVLFFDDLIIHVRHYWPAASLSLWTKQLNLLMIFAGSKHVGPSDHDNFPYSLNFKLSITGLNSFILISSISQTWCSFLTQLTHNGVTVNPLGKPLCACIGQSVVCMHHPCLHDTWPT